MLAWLFTICPIGVQQHFLWLCSWEGSISWGSRYCVFLPWGEIKWMSVWMFPPFEYVISVPSCLPSVSVYGWRSHLYWFGCPRRRELQQLLMIFYKMCSSIFIAVRFICIVHVCLHACVLSTHSLIFMFLMLFCVLIVPFEWCLHLCKLCLEALVDTEWQLGKHLINQGSLYSYAVAIMMA